VDIDTTLVSCKTAEVLPPLEALLLDLLAARSPTYGLDLVASSRGRLKRGSVYVTLGRMEHKGLVRSRLDERPGEGPPRRLYEPTPLGLRALVATQLLDGDLPLRGLLRQRS
jgi:PadR family transcriptional regulator, regulatory protein PadR